MRGRAPPRGSRSQTRNWRRSTERSPNLVEARPHRAGRCDEAQASTDDCGADGGRVEANESVLGGEASEEEWLVTGAVRISAEGPGVWCTRRPAASSRGRFLRQGGASTVQKLRATDRYANRETALMFPIVPNNVSAEVFNTRRAPQVRGSLDLAGGEIETSRRPSRLTLV